LRRGRNHHQQSSNGGTVGVPIRPKYEVLDPILIREDKQQEGMPIKGKDRTKKNRGKRRGESKGEKTRRETEGTRENPENKNETRDRGKRD
jgi:hypothetical protein